MLGKIGKSLLALFLMMSGFSSFLEVEAAEANAPKKITGIASISAKSTDGYEIEKAIDGDLSTYWQSPRSSQGSGVPVNEYKYDHNRYIDITLDGTYDLSSIKIFNEVGGYYNYYIYASMDGVNYDRIIEKTSSSLATAEGDSFSVSAKASYLRINMAYNSTKYETNIKEIELYGNKVSTQVNEPEPVEVQKFAESEWSAKWEQFESNQVYAENKTIAEMNGLVSRVIGSQYVDNFQFELRDEYNIVDGNGKDVFEIESVNNKIVIRGNDGVSMASGFNYYLKYLCNVDYNPVYTSSNMTMPATLPVVSEKIVKDTQYDYRYALNFCTYSYSMAFWGWDEYEEFIDWAAMNGINLMLDIVGQEEVLREFLSTYGYSQDEINDYISGPAYFAWFYMQNLDSFGGPLPDGWYEQRAELGRKMHDRMQAYGIDPVIQGFSGMIPYDFAEKAEIPASDVLDVGDWPGYKRPFMLRTHKSGVNEVTDSYKEAAKRFYQAQKDVFGDISDYYAVDPFHEGGVIPKDMNIQNVYYQVQKELFANNGEDSIWVMQQWQGGISDGKLQGLVDNSKAIVLDLQSDMNPQNSPMENTKTPWIWNMLHNFGGRMGMDGEVSVIANNIPEAMNQSKYMVGIGITPEAIENSPIVYELLFDMTWEKDPIDYKEWTYQYAQRRYNIASDSAETIADMNAAYDILLDTVYSDKDIYIQGAAESVVNARPTSNFGAASTWGHSTIPYDKEELEKAVDLFKKHYDELKDSPAFVYDFTDLLEQVLSNSAVEYHKLMMSAYESKDVAEFTRLSNHFLEEIKLSDEILGTSEKFMLGTWIDNARTMLDTDTYQMDDWSRDLFEFNARALVTTWGAQKNNSLKDYSNRKWAGLTDDFYLQRWTIWVENRIANLEGKKANDPNWFLWEWQWANRKSDAGSSFTTTPSDLNLADAATTVMKDFSMTNISDFVSGGALEQKVNIAIGKPIEANFAPTSGNTSNLVDNNTGSNYVYGGSKDNVIMEMDMNGVAAISEFALAFNQGAGVKPFTYKIEYLDPETSVWELVKEDTSGALQANETIPFKCTASKIRYTFKTNDLSNSPVEVTELYVYGKMIKEIEYINHALNKPVITEGSAQNPPKNVTDGDLKTLWIENGGVFGQKANVIIDLQGIQTIEFVEIYFEKAGLPFQYKVEANIGDGDEWTMILDNSKSEEATPAKVSVPYNKDVRKIKVTLTGKNKAGTFPGAWAAIAEVKALAQKKNDKVEFNVGENVALNKNVTVPAGEDKKKFIVDGLHNGKFDRWEQGTGTYPSQVTVDLGGTFYLDEVLAGMEDKGYGFKYKLEIIDSNGERIMIADRSAVGELAGDDKYIHIPVDAYATKVIFTETANGIGTAYAAWPCLSELQAIAGKPTSLSSNATLTSNGFTQEALNALLDDLKDTKIQFNAAGNKELLYTLNEAKDVNFFELVKTAGAALQYKVYYKDKNQTWTEVVDQSKNTADKTSNTYSLDKVINAKEFKFVILNDDVTISDINVFEGSATGPLKSAILSTKGVLASKKVGDYAGYYPQSAANALNAAIAVAQAKVDANVNAVEVEAAILTLNEALDTFLASGPLYIDRGALTAILSKSEIALAALTKTTNTALTTALKTEYDAAKAIHDTYLVTQAQMDAATLSLTTVYNANQAIVEAILAYQTALSEAEKQVANTPVGDKDGNVAQADKDTFDAAIATAKNGFTDAANDVGKIQLVTDTLMSQIETFKSKKITIDKTQLQAAINDVATVNKQAYTTTSYKAFETALANATKVVNSTNVGQDTVDNAKATLVSTKTELVARGDVGALDKVVFGYVTSSLTQSDVTSASWTVYQTNLEAAQSALNNNADLSQAAVDARKEALTTAYNNLIGVPTALTTLINEQASLKETDYTRASWKALQEVLTTGRTLANSSNPKYVDIQASIKTIKTAVTNLKAPSDRSALQTKIDDLTKLNLVEANYTAATWTVYAAKLADAKKLADNDEAGADAITTMVTELENAYQALIVDKTALQTLVDAQATLNESMYTPESWANLQAALTSANAVLAKDNPTLSEVTTAKTALQTAVNNLVSNADKTALQALMDSIDAENLKQADYTTATWTTFATAKTEAQKVLDKENTTTAEIKTAFDALTAGHKGLRVDKTTLQTLVDAQATLIESMYTAESWANLQTALTSANTVLAKENPTPSEVTTAKTALQTAESNLVLSADKTALQALMDTIDAENLKQADYTTATWTTFATAKTEAQNVLDKDGATTAEIKTALDALTVAHEGLRADLTPLQTLVDAQGKLVQSDYTNATWNALQSALTDAKGLIKTNNATLAELNTALTALQTAVDSLEKVITPGQVQEQIDTYEKEALNQTDYTVASWNMYQTKLTDAKAILKDLTASATALKTANDALIEAHDALVSVVSLKTAIANIGELVEEQYTTSSWATYQEALTAATSLLTVETAVSSEMVETSITTLQAKKEALTARSDNTALKAYVDELASQSDLVEGNYTPASWDVYANALQSAQAILNDNRDITQTQADDALNNLKDAYSKLVMTNIKPLLELIQQVEGMAKDKELYTSTSWNDLQKALDSAKEIANASDQPSDVVNARYLALQDAKAKLVKRGDKTTLQATMEEFKTLKETDYTTDSWKTYATALQNATAVLQNVDAIQSDIDTVKASLIAAKDALVEKTVDKTELKALIEASAKLEEKAYTTSSWATFKTAYEQAIAIKDKTTATQDEVNQSIVNLTTAKNALVARGDKTALSTTLEKANRLQEGAYVSSSWSTFAQAKAEAEKQMQNVDALQQDIDVANANLAKAMESLVLRGDKSALNEYLNFATTITSSEYTTTSWTAFEQAIQAAQAVQGNDDATSEDVAKALTSMKQAYQQLTKIYKPEDKVVVGEKDLEFSMDANTSVVNPDAKLKVELVKDAENVELIKKAYASGDAKKYLVFDISILLDGAKVQPDGMVELSMLVPEGYDIKQLKLFYIDDQGVRHEMEYRYENGRVYFKTNHFSYYSLAEMKTSTPEQPEHPSNPEKPGKPQVPSIPSTPSTSDKTGATTGDQTNFAEMMMLCMIGGCLVVYSRKKVRNK